MIELELKAVVPDPAALVDRLRKGGAREVFVGRLVDRRYDFPGGPLLARDEVVRLREHIDQSGKVSATLEWKGPSSTDAGYKRREEIGTGVNDSATIAMILSHVGLRVVRTIERDIHQFNAYGATVRLEHYARMDDLVEVEGDPAAIEQAIALTGLARAGFSTQSLSEFALRYQARTGLQAVTGRLGEETPRNA